MQERLLGHRARSRRALARLALWIAAVGMIAMTAMVAWQVFSRYVLNASPSWTEAASILVMSWFIFLGAAVGVRENFHMGFDVLVHFLPDARRALDARRSPTSRSSSSASAWWSTAAADDRDLDRDHPGARPARRLLLHADRRRRRADDPLRPRAAGAARSPASRSTTTRTPKTSLLSEV